MRRMWMQLIITLRIWRLLNKGKITKDKTLVYSRILDKECGEFQHIYVHRGKHGLYYLTDEHKHWSTDTYLKGLEHKYNQHLIMIGDCVRIAFNQGDIK